MTRYNEIMERVEVTPEMRERVLANATEAAAQPVKRRGGWKPFALAAACLALVLLGSLTLPKLANSTETGPQPTDALTQGGWEMAEYDSAEALSTAAGFSVSEIPALQDSAGESQFRLIGGNLAEIEYRVADAVFWYRVSPGSEDNSGDYNEYPATQRVEIDGVSVTLKGDGDSCNLALWSTDGLSFSISTGCDVSFADMEAYAASALQNGK